MKLKAFLSGGQVWCDGAQPLRSGNFLFAVMKPSRPGKRGGPGGSARAPPPGQPERGGGIPRFPQPHRLRDGGRARRAAAAGGRRGPAGAGPGRRRPSRPVPSRRFRFPFCLAGAQHQGKPRALPLPLRVAPAALPAGLREPTPLPCAPAATRRLPASRPPLSRPPPSRSPAPPPLLSPPAPARPLWPAAPEAGPAALYLTPKGQRGGGKRLSLSTGHLWPSGGCTAVP